MKLIIEFGSTVTGKEPGKNVVDIGVLLGRQPSLEEESRLAADLQEVVQGRAVDLLVLDRADPLLRGRAAGEGRLL